ncbi:hypothetical protein LEP1GSC016_3371 [Leptospira borgpetersenii serovar Hardjo-bovis str. Sponselee]|uniref:Uncharacterized protein n=1 Tax=Leptospira borgpetersenii serovar Hardjo-bovis str. Sponselee TaxID=1303729 RepID=M6BT51_LEPBO|nr:hypothetical protein LBK6_13450 [Leptospira borgpetersenii serovar Hardjo]AWV71031.1 hypothetical protein B9T54_14415 [Leptospira borgpetersenii serovar Hardjo-bovis]EMJ77015.1 hypothetical protein LEP1GSC016_3371 [Leptospira borgpetersenii serovar Hardjo-bovis str. Sponselee]AMX62521.1 hypothetical protein LBK9_13360 [Leptospira borgpetersenii serovar Hardjo]AMX65763.1 hypothetical protein LBK30_13375 [Leptospira borgpetersenii serovar Hardjo]
MAFFKDAIQDHIFPPGPAHKNTRIINGRRRTRNECQDENYNSIKHEAIFLWNESTNDTCFRMNRRKNLVKNSKNRNEIFEKNGIRSYLKNILE